MFQELEYVWHPGSKPTYDLDSYTVYVRYSQYKFVYSHMFVFITRDDYCTPFNYTGLLLLHPTFVAEHRLHLLWMKPTRYFAQLAPVLQKDDSQVLSKSRSLGDGVIFCNFHPRTLGKIFHFDYIMFFKWVETTN